MYINSVPIFFRGKHYKITKLWFEIKGSKLIIQVKFLASAFCVLSPFPNANRRVLQLEIALLARCRLSIEFNLRVDPKGSETSTLCRPRWGKVNEEISNVFQMGRQTKETSTKPRTRTATAVCVYAWMCACVGQRARDWNDSNSVNDLETCQRVWN